MFPIQLNLWSMIVIGAALATSLIQADALDQTSMTGVTMTNPATKTVEKTDTTPTTKDGVITKAKKSVKHSGTTTTEKLKTDPPKRD